MRRILLGAALVAASVSAPSAWAAEPPSAWVAATADKLVERSRDAAIAGGADALARLALIFEVNEEAGAGVAARALAKVAASSSPVAADAAWLGAMLEPEKLDHRFRDVTRLALDGKAHKGLVRTFSVLGPFEDTGGGLARAEGPETESHDYRTADYSWGVYSVRPRRSLVTSVTARGLPLDLYVSPRKESCSYLSAVVALRNHPAAARKIVVRVAASGAFRLRWDRTDVVVDQDAQRDMVFDRRAVLVDAGAGDHLLTVKVCSAAQPDSGRVRVRLTDEQGHPLELDTSSEPGRLQAAWQRGAGAKATAVKTALERALDLGDAPDPRAALGAAILRQLAGAENVQSLQASGLLDAIAGAPDVRPDELALAGYVTPFAANRSGWLQQAHDRARKLGDADTVAFSQRALVVARLAARQYDLARATAAAPPLSQAHDAAARWLRATVQARQGNSGMVRGALRELDELVAAHGPRTPLTVLRSIAAYAGRMGTARQRLGALQRLAALDPDEMDATFVRAHEVFGAGTVESLAARVLLYQTDADEVIAIAGELRRLGRYQAARRAFGLAAHLGPNKAEAHRGLGRALLSLGSTGAPTMAALERARELEPSDAALGAEIAYRSGKTAGGVELGDDARYLVAPAVFLKRAKDKPAPAVGLFSRQLHWRRVVRLHPDKRVSQTMHYAREIIIAPRTEGERYERVPGGHGTELLLARVHKKDGTTEAPEEQETAGAMIRWPQLERGDVVEVAVRSWTPGPIGRRGDPPFYFVDYVGSVVTRPVMYNEVVIDAPEGSPLGFDVVGGKPDRLETERRDGRLVTYLAWDDAPNIPDEPLAPEMSELLPVVVGSAYPSWKEFLGWYRGAVKGFTQPDEQIRRLADELTAGKKTREARLKALFDFVADDIRYVNYQSGEWWLPNRPQHLLARRQGDCDDKAMLLISLLGAVGIQASEVLVQTRYTDNQRILREAKIAVPMFDHGIVYLPDESGKGGRYLDATSPQSRSGSLPSMDHGAIGLLVEDGATPQVMPWGTAADHGVDAEWTIELDATGGGKLRAKERHVGDAAFYLRTGLQRADARAQYVESRILSRWLSNVELDAQVKFDGELEGGDASLEYSGSSTAIARKEGDDLLVTLAPRVAFTAQLAPLVKRTLPVRLPPHVAPGHYDMAIEVKAPKGYRFAELPPDADEDGGAFGRASLSYLSSRDKRSVTIKRTLSFGAASIPAADYPKWRAWLRGIDRIMQRSLRLVKQ